MPDVRRRPRDVIIASPRDLKGVAEYTNSMDEAERELIRTWKRNQDAVNEITLQEDRDRTPDERFRLLMVMLARAAAMGLLVPREDDFEFHLRWHKARMSWHVRNS